MNRINVLIPVFLLVLFPPTQSNVDKISFKNRATNRHELYDIFYLKNNIQNFSYPLEPLLEEQCGNLESHLPGAVAKGNIIFDLWRLYKNLQPYYLPKIANVGGDCAVHLNAMGFNHWTINMVDSWGKFPDGILAGNVGLIGFYEECIDIHVTELSTDFHGKYCAISYESVDGSSSRSMNGYFWYGTCMPSSCDAKDLEDSLNQVLAPDNLKVSSIACQTQERYYDYNGATIFMITLLSLIGAVMFAALCVDYWIFHTGNEKLELGNLKYLLVWSPYRNMQKIFHISTKQTSESIDCLHGMRTLSMTWVILGHQYIYDTIVNPLQVDNTLNNTWMSQLITNALPSVDTFFFMSGLLVSYNLTKEVEKTKKFNAPMYYIHRFIRLSPPMFIIVGALATLPPLFIFGPLSPTMLNEHAVVYRCRHFWYRDPLFLNNFFYYNGDTESCLPQCWYTANDMDLYILAPIMVLPLIFYGSIGGAWLVFWTILSVAIPATLHGVFQMPPTQGLNMPLPDWQFYTTWIYTKPWSRAGPYVVGLWMGYFFWNNRKSKITLKPWMVISGWTIATITGICVVFGVRKYMQILVPPVPYHPAESILYGGFSRLAWGVAVGWVVFACKFGYGGPVNSFLSHPSWQPLSRLTYCMYLVAIPIQELLYWHAPFYPNYFSPVNKIIEAMGAFFFIGLTALGVSLVAEAPVLGIERLTLRKTPTSKDEIKTSNSKETTK